VLVLLVGVIQLLAGPFRLRLLLRFVSNAVMTGFLNGDAVLGDPTGYWSAKGRGIPRSGRSPQNGNV
jgi:hypothetical protein